LTRLLFDHLELISIAAFITVTALTRFLCGRFSSDPWFCTACAAIVLAVFHGCIGYAVRRRQRTLRHTLLKQAENLIEEEVKVDARLLLDRLSAGQDKPSWEIESARRVVEVVDYVSQVHDFLLSDPLIGQPGVAATRTRSRLEGGP
jgi:hypothetical protein